MPRGVCGGVVEAPRGGRGGVEPIDIGKGGVAGESGRGKSLEAGRGGVEEGSGNGGVVDRSTVGEGRYGRYLLNSLRPERVPGMGGVWGLYSSGGGGVHGMS